MSRFERAHASAHCLKGTTLTIRQSNTTLLIDTATSAVLDIHVTTREGERVRPSGEPNWGNDPLNSRYPRGFERYDLQ